MYQDADYHFANFFPDEAIRPFALLLSQRLREGHICIPVDDTETDTPLGPVSTQYLSRVSDKILATSDAPVPFIYFNQHLYLQRYFRYETKIVRLLKQRLQSASENKSVYRTRLESIKTLINEQVSTYDLEGLKEDERVDWQLIAVIRVMLNDFSIITGGPGTGKTTTLAKLLLVLYSMHPDCRVALAAPTGKASMRMVESLRERTKDYPEEIVQHIRQLKPFTLHRLIGNKPNSIHFKHNENVPLPYDWLIIDEASMIDVPMFAKLLSACAPSTRVLLLGDKDQLASVEAGSLLGDLCLSVAKLNRYQADDISWLNSFIEDKARHIPDSYASDKEWPLAACITELRLSRRFLQQGGVGKLSMHIIKGAAQEALDLLKAGAFPDIKMIMYDQEEIFHRFLEGYYGFMEEPDIDEALKKINHLRVLVAVREGKTGLYAVNQKIERILHVLRPDLIKPQEGFYVNRPVMITQNNYELGLFNGDVGIVRKDPASGRIKVWFEATEQGKPLRSFNTAYLSSCETVFAMTIHKSQGSEFDNVFVLLPEDIDNPLLTRELLYTGITRARQSVIIQGTEEGLLSGIHRRVLRISGVQSRMQTMI
jgi:exodeoxyribonuclease V alpha subunit